MNIINTIIKAKMIQENIIVTVIQTLANSHIENTLHVSFMVEGDNTCMEREIKGSKAYVLNTFDKINNENYRTI